MSSRNAVSLITANWAWGLCLPVYSWSRLRRHTRADSNGLIQNSLLVLSMLYSAQVYDTQGIDYLVYSYQRTFLIWSGRGFSQFLFNLHVGMYLPTDMHSEWNHFGFSIRSV